MESGLLVQIFSQMRFGKRGKYLNLSAQLGSFMFGIICARNYALGRQALLLDSGPGHKLFSPMCIITVLIWCCLLPLAFYLAQRTAGSTTLAKIVSTLGQEQGKNHYKRRKHASRWAMVLQSIWVVCILEVAVMHWKPEKTKSPGKYYLLLPMVFMAVFVVSLFRYFSQINHMVKCGLEDKVQSLANEFARGKDNEYEIVSAYTEEAFGWHGALVRYHEHVSAAHHMMKPNRYGRYFHAVVIGSFFWFCSGILNIMRELQNLKKEWQQEHLDVMENHVDTIGLIVLNVIYVGSGFIFLLWDTLLLMAEMNSTKIVMTAAERYLVLKGNKMLEAERVEWRGYVEMVRSLSGTSPICRLFVFPITRNTVLGSLIRYGVWLPAVVIFIVHCYNNGISEALGFAVNGTTTRCGVCQCPPTTACATMLTSNNSTSSMHV